MVQLLQLAVVFGVLHVARVHGFRTQVSKQATKDLAQAHGVSESKGCRLNDSFECPEWLCKNLLGMFFDVKLFCKFPTEDFVVKGILKQQQHVVQHTGRATVYPGMDRLVLTELSSNTTEEDVAMKGIHDGMMVPHIDKCASSTEHAPETSGAQIYQNIKALLDTFDIYTRCTKAYVVNKDNEGRPKMVKDDIIAISTEMAAGFFSLSYEDVTQYQEYEDKDGTKILEVIISSRKDNIIEGNYNVIVRHFKDDYIKNNDKVEIEYTKRQNLVPWLLKKGISHNGYTIMTQQSVDVTIRKLAYAGLYGAGSVESAKDGGCFPYVKCADYETLDTGDICVYDMECKSHSCNKVSSMCFWWGCERKCAEE